MKERTSGSVLLQHRQPHRRESRNAVYLLGEVMSPRNQLIVAAGGPRPASMLTGLISAFASLATSKPACISGTASPAIDAVSIGAGAVSPARKPGNSGQVIGAVTAGNPSVSAFAICIDMAQ